MFLVWFMVYRREAVDNLSGSNNGCNNKDMCGTGTTAAADTTSAITSVGTIAANATSSDKLPPPRLRDSYKLPQRGDNQRDGGEPLYWRQAAPHPSLTVGVEPPLPPSPSSLPPSLPLLLPPARHKTITHGGG